MRLLCFWDFLVKTWKVPVVSLAWVLTTLWLLVACNHLSCPMPVKSLQRYTVYFEVQWCQWWLTFQACVKSTRKILSCVSKIIGCIYLFFLSFLVVSCLISCFLPLVLCLHSTLCMLILRHLTYSPFSVQLFLEFEVTKVDGLAKLLFHRYFPSSKLGLFASVFVSFL